MFLIMEIISQIINITNDHFHVKRTHLNKLLTDSLVPFAVRGMWTDRPENWPTDIPYCDPNNKKDSGKPKKNTLLQMFIYLKGVYTSNHSVRDSQQVFKKNFLCNFLYFWKIRGYLKKSYVIKKKEKKLEVLDLS